MSAVDPRLTRRTLLVGSLGVAAACTSPRRPAADPDAAAVAAARAGELQLLAGSPVGSAARDAHTAHLRALGGTLPTESAAPATPVPATPVPAPGPALRQSVVTLQAAANAAQRGATAALLASIAASHAAMPAAP